MTDISNLDKLEVDYASTRGMTNPTQVQRELDAVKTGALLSIARSLESTKVPDHWEALEGPSGAILGWFDPQVARSIAQALGASQARAEHDPTGGRDDLLIEVGSMVSLTEALEHYDLDNVDDDGNYAALVDIVAMGEVVDIGIDQDEQWALVRWQDHPNAPANGRVWSRLLTVLEPLEPEADEREADVINGVDTNPPVEVATLDGGGGANSGFDIEPDNGPAEAPEPEVDDDDIDADFDTVVEAEPAPAVDGLSALKGKSKRK